MLPDRPGSRTLRTAAVLLLATVIAGACKPLDDAMATIFGRSMRSSVSFDPYENPQRPDSNAVSFASGNYPAAPGVVNVGEPEGLEEDVPPMTQADLTSSSDVVNSLVNPVPADSASLARGQVMYERMCSVCHGPNGSSAEALILPKHPMMAAFDLATGNSVGFTDGYIYGMIRVGRGLMPPYGHRITHFDRWHIVNYLRELQRRAGQTPGGAAEEDGAAAAEAGGAGGGA
jgi:mono/diheme cytochrome c family protein